MSYQHYERIYDFSGGLNNRDFDPLLQDNESPDMCNVVLGKRGTFETRPGIIYFKNEPVVEGKSVTSIYEYIDPQGNTHFLAFAGDKLKKATQDGWALVGEDLEEGSYLEFVTNPMTGKALFVNHNDGYWETDGNECDEVDPYEPTDDEKTEIGECAIPNDPMLIAYHKYRVWLANVSDYPDRIYYSVDDISGNTLYNYFTPSSWLRSSNPKGEGVTAIVSFKERLYVFTKSTIKVIVGSDLDDFSMIDFDQSIGTVSSRTVWNFGDHLIFLSADNDVYIFDGVSAPTKVSGRLEGTFNKISAEYKYRACAALHRGKYYLSIPESTVNDVTLVYDTEVVPLTYVGEKHSYVNSPWTLHKGFTPTQWLVGQDLNLYFASTDGYVYQYGIGTTDAGKAIEAYLCTKLIDLGTPDKVKRIRRLILDARREEDSFINIEYKIDSESNGWETLCRDVDLSKPIDRMFIYFPNSNRPLCRKIAFKISNSYLGNVFRINGFTIDMAVHGHHEERK